jgi:hypothetical protein
MMVIALQNCCISLFGVIWIGPGGAVNYARFHQGADFFCIRAGCGAGAAVK